MIASSGPKIMGIINITPDSATSVGRYLDPNLALQHAIKLVEDGADILDLGAEATNPTIHPCISLQEEMDRLLPVLELICQELTVPVSVDTSKPEIMQEAIKLGAAIINDTRALQREGAIEVIAESNVMVCLMHMSFPEGKPNSIQFEEFEPDVLSVIKKFLEERIAHCEAHGISRSRLIIDPGLGFGNFGKCTKDNLKIINHLTVLKDLNLPILIGASRKTFIGDILQNKIEERMIGSAVVAALAVYNGANIIRAHDVKPTREAVKIAAEMLYVQ